MVRDKAAFRVQKQRDLRVAAGWHEVKVWVPTKQDADDIRSLAAQRRADAEALNGFKEEVPNVNIENANRIADAVAKYGSTAYIHAAGAVLDLMTELANEDDLQSFSRAFILLARAQPSSAPFAADFIPPKISNFLIKHRNIGVQELHSWTNANPGWANVLKGAICDPEQFERTVQDIAYQIRSS